MADPERRARLPSLREIDFDRLPRKARERLVAATSGRDEPRPLVATREAPSVGAEIGLALAGVATAAVVAIRGFGDGVQGARSAAVYALGALVAAVGALGALAVRAGARSLPLAPGRYLFPRLFVDARTPRLRIAWLDAGVELRVKRGAEVVLEASLSDGSTVEIPGEPAALETARAAVAEATAGDDGADVDPLFDARDAAPTDAHGTSGPLARPLPLALRPVPRGAVALVLATACGLALFTIRNRWSDDAMFDRARRDGTIAALDAYAAGGGRHAAEASRLAERARADAAKRAGAELANRYAAALAAFRARASTEEPQLVPVVEHLLATLERRGDPRVPLSFRPPTRAVLDAVDTILVQRAGDGPPIAKVAPHFDASRTKAYEPDAARAIAAAFAETFPADVLRIEPGETSDDQPSISVGYLVGWGGDAVVDTPGNRRYVSVVVDFTVSLDVPGEAALVLKFRVMPPDDLEVKVDADAANATEDQVYAAMATHAFRAVGAHVRSALYRK